MKLRTGNPWMPADEYGRSLRGLSINLLVADVARSKAFQTEVLGAELVYADPDFAVLRGFGGEWMLHAEVCRFSRTTVTAFATGQPSLS